MDDLNRSMFEWEPLIKIPTDDLIRSRQQFHHAVQFIAAAGKYLIEERADDSHTAMHWNDNIKSFEGETINGNQKIKIGFRPADFSLYISTDIESNIISYGLHLKTKRQVFTWLVEQLKNFEIDVSNFSLKMHYDIPSDFFNDDGLFEVHNQKHINALSLYYSNANQLLNAVKKVLPEISEIRCWPHHFDIATLYTIDKDTSAEEARTIGIGLAPGDEDYKEPYIYITSWPYPDMKVQSIPHLPAGRWHTEGWVGAILHAPDIYGQKDQKQEILNFMNHAIKACAELLNYTI